MISFKDFYLKEEVETTFHQKEPIKIRGIGEYVAKVDSGNDAYCVIHGDDIVISDNDVTFKTDKGVSITKPLIDTIEVNVGADTLEKRPIVEFDIKIKGEVYKNVKFSIGNRKENDEKVLIGLKFLKPLNAIIEIK
jgi:hypothetical protein